MEVNVTGAQIEQKELEEIDAILPTLCKEDLLTDIECRLIAFHNTLMEKRGAVYIVIMSKLKEEAAILTEIFRKLTASIHCKENSTSLEENNHSVSVIPSRNPFLNNTIIKHLLGFLPLKDMKRSRLVCRLWNSTAEICLRKRSKIYFRPNALRPHAFMEISKYCPPDLPFPSFVFSNDENSNWHISNIQYFLEKWAKNIKDITFHCVTLVSKPSLTDKEVLIPNYDLTPLFTNPSNITSVQIRYPPDGKATTKFDICLAQFVSVKTLCLNSCRIILPTENQITRIAPINVNLQNVIFLQNGNILKHFHYNDLFDFSKALNINLEADDEDNDCTKGIFDISKQIFSLNQLSLDSVHLENWAQAKGHIKSVFLYGIPFLEENHLKIKWLSFLESTIELTSIPQTLESLCMPGDSDTDINCMKPLYLPNLEKLKIVIVKNCDNLSYFSNFLNLVSLEIINQYFSSLISGPCTLNLSYIPKSVKRMAIDILQLEFSDNCIFELDVLTLLVLCSTSLVLDCAVITSQIKAKILIIVDKDKNDFDTSDFVRLVQAKMYSQKILLSSYSDLHKKTPFEGSELSKCVDKKSNFYQFENNFGMSITKEEFQRCCKLEDYTLKFE